MLKWKYDKDVVSLSGDSSLLLDSLPALWFSVSAMFT
jgi:hypothetical protein